MKKLLICAALLCSITACAPLAALSAALPSHEIDKQYTDPVLLNATKAFTVAADAYTTAANLATFAVQHDSKLTAAQLRRIRELNDGALKLLNGSSTALGYGDRATGLFRIVVELHSIIGK